MMYVALLRGINVGGNRTIRMAELKSAFERAGMSDIKTYINSGNVVFRTGVTDSIALERTRATGLSHVDGAVSMARDGPDSATSDFFLCLGDQPSLDFGGRRNPDGQGFAAFGRVVRGMEVVRRIQQSPAEGQRLTPPIAIVTVRRLP